MSSNYERAQIRFELKELTVCKLRL